MMHDVSLGLLLQWFFFVYLLVANCGYLMLNALSYFSLRRQLAAQAFGEFPGVYSQFKPPITLIVHVHNQASTIVALVRSLLQLAYHEFEVILVNDGSRDDTLAQLRREFELAPFAEAYWNRLATRPVLGIWRSTRYPNLRVIDKEYGGKADSLNAGINIARYPLFCAMGTDAILLRNSLELMVQPFIEDARTIAAGGAVRVANGCQIDNGLLTSARLPHGLLARLQIVEYLSSFLFSRLGWTQVNAMLTNSALGLFRKASVIEVGGYRSGSIGEDAELVMRLHRIHRKRNIPYRIEFVPNPICWTEAPSTLGELAEQRIRWQRGLAESLVKNVGLLFSLRGGFVGWIAFPFALIFDCLGPLFEATAYVMMTAGLFYGLVSLKTFAAFMLVALVPGVLISISALLMEEMSFPLYPRLRQLASLVLLAIGLNFGYRQLIMLWRLKGLVKSFFVAGTSGAKVTFLASGEQTS